MPVLPLFDTPADPDAWHRVTAPGGYERWHFDAEDEARGIRVIVEFVEGEHVDTDYVRRYHRYLSRPTRVRPPQAREYPSVWMSVYEKGRVLSAGATHHRPDEFCASERRPDVRVGANGFSRESDGSLHVEVRQPRCSADLVFRPLVHHAPLERSLLPDTAPRGEHRWVIAQPLCRVVGVVRIAGSDSGPPEIPIAGLGYHDHYFGTGPLRTSVGRRLWGRVLAEDRVLGFHLVTPASPGQPDHAELLEVDASGVRLIPVAAPGSYSARRGTRGVVYPATLALGERLSLHNPRLLDSYHDRLRLEYDAACEGVKRTAFCEVAR